MPNPVAILTGDFVGSTDAAPGALDQAMAELAAAAADLKGWTHDDTRFTRFRGDGWQLSLTDQNLALRAALFILAKLRATRLGLSTRIAIGIGSAETLGTADLGDARGEAFEQSGRALDAMKKWQTLTIAGQGVADLHAIIVQLIDAQARRWTPEQAEAMALALHPDNPTLNDLAGTLGISSQAVSYRLAGAAGRDIRAALAVWELQEEQRDFGKGPTA